MNGGPPGEAHRYVKEALEDTTPPIDQTCRWRRCGVHAGTILCLHAAHRRADEAPFIFSSSWREQSEPESA